MKQDYFLNEVPLEFCDEVFLKELRDKKKQGTTNIKTNFILSRLALKFCLEALSKKKIANPEELDLKNFQELSGFPHYVFSLGHTRGLAGAFVVYQKSYFGGGLDIEELGRRIDPLAYKFFVNNFDDESLEKLFLWCCKEAAYKAISGYLIRSNGYNENLTLKKIWIKKDFFGLSDFPSEPLGFVELKTIKVDKKTFVVAEALLTKKVDKFC